MTTTIDLAAEYIQEWPDHSCIENTAQKGLADEDRQRLIDAYGDRADAIATEIVRLCRERVASEAHALLWVLGAPDPEMEAIEQLLTAAGEVVTHATADGRRVHPGSAYRADAVQGATHWVECAPIGGHPDGAVVIDHHRPGDPGYGRPPAEFLQASSIGQVLMVVAPRESAHAQTQDGELYRDASGVWRLALGADHYWDSAAESIVVPEAILLTAAADHCLAAAYRGACPGVVPDELMRWRVAGRAAFQQRPEAELLADVESTRQAIREARGAVLERTAGSHCGEGSCGCRDGGYGYGGSTSAGNGDCYCDCDGCRHGDHYIRVADMRRDPPYPELPEAGAREGVGYISGPLLAPDGRKKITCSGSQEQVAAFLGSWAPSEGLVDIYGDPARGFAGGYLRE